jgi:translation initiation factor IF-2
MTQHTSKVRLYDLAKELKLDTKRLIEEVRREGVDVSVPSNSVSKELADKIRNKYFPKKEASAPRAVKVIKKIAQPEAETAMPPGTVISGALEMSSPTEEGLNGEGAEQQPAPASMPQAPAAPRPSSVATPLVKRLTPATRAEPPSPATTSPQTPPPPSIPLTPTQDQTAAPALEEHAPAPSQAAPAAPSQTTLSTEQPAPMSAAGPAVSEPTTSTMTTTPAPPMTQQPEATRTSSSSVPPMPAGPSRQVRVLRPTAAALNEGIKPGERVNAPALPAPPTPAVAPARERERDQRGDRGGRGGGGAGRDRAARAERPERSGTPGETATPQITYIPQPGEGRRRPGRGGRGPAGAHGGRKVQERGGGRVGDRDILPPPKPLIDRITGGLNTATVNGELKPVRLIEGSTVKEFAEKLGIKPKDVVTLLLQRGVFATINQPLNDEIAVELGKRLGFQVSFVPFEEMVTEEEFEGLIETGGDDVELPRAPVVTVMGHVDHGKTSLLDGIRTTDVAGGEAGGITQHIGAYSVQVTNPDIPTETRRVVFLDTPGHEAFTMMRARGAKATDVVVLVVAADDGVMPQTIEAIEHSRAAGVPIVVAINKVDKPDANPDRVKQELSNQGLQPVEWGGETEMVQVSAKKRENLDNLLETILLTADILNLRASPTRLASGVVLEAKLDRGRGSVATVLVQQGTLRVGDPFIVGQIFGKVRAMFDDKGQPVSEAGPATPVEVLGLQGVPQAGEAFQVVADITKAQQISHHRQMLTRQNTLLQTTKRGLDALGQTEVKELLVIIKADVQGSVEVLKSTLQKLSTDAVKVKVIRSGVGAITESDVLLASATQEGAAQTAVLIIGFNVRPETRAADLAKQEAVDIRLHSIIYKVEEEIRAAMIGMLEAVEKERILGKAEIREVFRVPKAGVVAGCMVVDGVIRRNARARLIRDGIVSWEGGIASLRRFKDDVSEVRQGFDCGIGLENFNDIKVGDQIEAYIVEKVAATEL